MLSKVVTLKNCYFNFKNSKYITIQLYPFEIWLSTWGVHYWSMLNSISTFTVKLKHKFFYASHQIGLLSDSNSSKHLYAYQDSLMLWKGKIKTWNLLVFWAVCEVIQQLSKGWSVTTWFDRLGELVIKYQSK